ncbi:2-dehydro-3-deoxygalactonokinase [Xylophilus ampelinus]|uniref:2-dehydro-3-deoxygalactonokinase n=1 Tax=Xylophilus ampelinus TaxID=54067 RepID=A0A318SID4_9BURK|nr:2-dehydro-3-deoxygalactonokinase [Xylophilus ampelinus]MCS4509818.1 2-dehydro-3-deoxygalactonokinase [Xylophilus ampelinus]PYE78653.1 2-dehydro-3-deoxygalactonokinase [Xylophilus ampelinus]
MHDAPRSRETRLVALDWGTSALRAFRFDAQGDVLQLRHRPWGMMHLPPSPDGRDDAPGAACERALQDACGDWLAADPGVPLLACGMVGSAQGWREARYLDVPASLDDLARGLTVVPRGAGVPLHIVPGLLQRADLPDVMRGEETQVLGVLADVAFAGGGPLLVGLPGTHSKWVVAERRAIRRFHTFMTGEVFAALRHHTILGRTMQAPLQSDDAAFARGLDVARGGDAAGLGLLSHIFSTRTLGLTCALPAEAQADYLSGVLIGHEVASLAGVHPPAAAAPGRVVLCGEPDLCRRYALALQACGFPPPSVAVQATAAGLWQIAQAAGLCGTHNSLSPLTESFTA